MADGVKTNKAALKWLERVGGTVIDDNGKEGKWAAYVKSDNEDGMAIYHGETIVEAVNNAIQATEG